MMPPMKTNRLMMNFLMASFLPLLAQEKSMSDGLRDALYLEEVKRDPAAAASAYESLLDGYAQQQQFAATALFRLAEIRRAEGRKDETIALYQRLIAQFPNADAKTKLAKENLAALGAKMPEAAATVVDEEDKELQRLKKLLDSSPDLVNLKELEAAVNFGYLRIVEWLMKDLKMQDREKKCLIYAVDTGNAKMTKLLIELLGDSAKEQLSEALIIACQEGYLEITRILLSAGADPNAADVVARVLYINHKLHIEGGCPLVVALYKGHFQIADILLKSGASINSVEVEDRITPLVALILSRNESIPKALDELVLKGADIHLKINVPYFLPNHRSPQGMFDPQGRVDNLLSLALIEGDINLTTSLLAKGAKKDTVGIFSCVDSLNENQSKVAQLFIEAGIDPNSKVHGGLSLLAMAYKQQHMNLVKLLLAKGANPNVESRLQEVGFHENIPNLTQVALYAGEVEDLLLFLNAGGDPGPQPKLDYAFNKAYTRDKLDTPLSAVKTLVEKGFSPSSEWRTRNFEGASNEVRAYLNERFPSEKPKTEEKPKEDPSR